MKMSLGVITVGILYADFWDDYGSHEGSLFPQESSSMHRFSCESNLIPVGKSEPVWLP